MTEKKYTGNSFGYDGKQVLVYPRFSNSTKGIPYVCNNLEVSKKPEVIEVRDCLSPVANLFDKIGRRLMICILKGLGLNPNLSKTWVSKSDHKLYLCKERSTYLESVKVSGKAHYGYGLLTMLPRSFNCDSLNIHSESALNSVSQYDENSYEMMRIDPHLEEYDIVILPGKTLENISAGYLEATSYNHDFQGEHNIFTQFELEAPGGKFIDCKKIHTGNTVVKNIPKKFEKPLEIINDITQFTTVAKKKGRFNPNTNRGSAVNLPGFLFKRIIMGEDSESG